MLDDEAGRTLTEHGKSKREERLVKALRDNLKRRKAASRETAVTAGGSEVAPRPASQVESKKASSWKG
jgi:hypothetical protein